MAKTENKSAYRAGARYERAAIVRFLNREIREARDSEFNFKTVKMSALELVKAWIVLRHSRYSKRKGGL
jgi:hypothetical protein